MFVSEEERRLVELYEEIIEITPEEFAWFEKYILESHHPLIESFVAKAKKERRGN